MTAYGRDSAENNLVRAWVTAYGQDSAENNLVHAWVTAHELDEGKYFLSAGNEIASVVEETTFWSVLLLDSQLVRGSVEV